MFAVSVASTLELYASDLAARTTYALATAPSVVSRVFGGPVSGPDIGSIVLNETFLFTAVAAAFMSTLAVVRHTRQNEETGRAELIGSAVTGRYASLTAAFIVVMLANALLGLFVTLSLLGNDLPAAGSVATGIAIAGTGCLFAAVAAVAAQISESARGANSLSAMVIGGAFLLRAMGDSLGGLVQNGMAVASAWPTWLSPIGWAQQIHPFTGQHWWAFGLLGVCALALVVVSFALTSHRDVGLGMLPVRQGPPTAPASLLSPLGLAWRLQKGILKGWAVAIAITAATYGLVAKEFETLLTENEAIADIMKQLGGGDSVTHALLGALLVFMSLTIAAYVVQALQRMRSEEAGGQLEPVLATAVSRPRWMLSHMTWVFLGAFLLVLITGLTMGITYVLATQGSIGQVFSLTGAALVHLPAILVLGGFAVFVFGLLPRLAIGLSWSSFGLCLLIGQFGSLLDLPQWGQNISPFTHTPTLPSETLTLAPLFLLVATALALCLAGLACFRRRDLTTA
jgi:ABC-2 type transport system permease protein